MDITFISIHDLSPEATILYTSDSVIDILGYTPEEIAGESAWKFFYQDELAHARKVHQKRVTMDNAAVLVYCNIKNKTGEYITCECCFTMVYDVMIVCTTYYRQTYKSSDRALAAPIVRRLFASSPKDPRYHMLSHLSSKFTQPAKATAHEPRAALFLNRFTRTLTIMYATSGIAEITGIPAAEMRGRSFYFCVSENCLKDAIECLEEAKGNDSIAYLRFWFRDPRKGESSVGSSPSDTDEEMTTDASVRDSSYEPSFITESADGEDTPMGDAPPELTHDSSGSSGESTRPADRHEAIFGTLRGDSSSASSVDPSPIERPARLQHDSSDEATATAIELEAVISCASDGLVVCLRRARPLIPPAIHRPSKPVYKNGLFAAPWARHPVLPPVETRPGAGYAPTFAPSLSPHGARHNDATASVRANGSSNNSDFMKAIRDQAIFAWALTSINGALANYCLSEPQAGAIPSNGLPIWANDDKSPATSPKSNASAETERAELSPKNGRHLPEAIRNDEQTNRLVFGDPGLARSIHQNGHPSGR